MGFVTRLRRVLASLFGLADDELELAAEEAASELQAARAVAASAISQAQRTELEVREGLALGPEHDARLAASVSRLEEERARARDQVTRYHELRRRTEEALARLGEARRLEALNAERDSLRKAEVHSAATLSPAAIARLEDQARAEAASLDLLEALDHGEAGLPPVAAGSPQSETDVRRRARELLEQQPFADALSDARPQ